MCFGTGKGQPFLFPKAFEKGKSTRNSLSPRECGKVRAARQVPLEGTPSKPQAERGFPVRAAPPLRERAEPCGGLENDRTNIGLALR